MINELISQINKTKIIETLNTLQIVIPNIIIDTESFTKISELSLSILQLTYLGEEYVITKYYLKINDHVEIALDENYQFSALNFYVDEDEHTIYAYDMAGSEKASYYINRDALTGYNNSTYMRKSTEDIYIPSFRPLSGEYEHIRKQLELTERLLCYSEKQDGRMCFYITIDQEFHYKIKDDLFIVKI